MHLSQFLAYKPCCPICESKLSTNLFSTRKYHCRYEDTNLVYSTNINFAFSLGKNNKPINIDIVMNYVDDIFYGLRRKTP